MCVYSTGPFYFITFRRPRLFFKDPVIGVGGVNVNCVRIVNWLFNVTINDISVIYVTAHRCAGGPKKTLDIRSGSQCHRHFAGFFNVPVQAPTRGQPFYTVIPTHRPNYSPFTTRWGYGGRILDLNPSGSRGWWC